MSHNLFEGFTDNKTPDMKYYAFDWDDNIVHMPTKIIVKTESGEEVGMSTDDFAEYRGEIGKTPFYYKGDKIVGFGNDPFRNFGVLGDKDFLIDSMRASIGPAFNDFKECINNGSIFSIITARGHNPNTLKEAVGNYIINGFGGIDISSLIKNLKKYREFTGEDTMNDEELITSYLNMNRFYPVSYNVEGGAKNPEQLKLIAMDDFVKYVKDMAALLNKKAYIKNDISNNFIPMEVKIGFSDDDLKNIELMKKHYEDKPEKLKTYLTSKGTKKQV